MAGVDAHRHQAENGQWFWCYRDHSEEPSVQADMVVAYCNRLGIPLLPWQEAYLRAVLRGESYLQRTGTQAENDKEQTA